MVFLITPGQEGHKEIRPHLARIH